MKERKVFISTNFPPKKKKSKILTTSDPEVMKEIMRRDKERERQNAPGGSSE